MIHLWTQSGFVHTRISFISVSLGPTGGMIITAEVLGHFLQDTRVRSRVGSVITSLGTFASWSLQNRVRVGWDEEGTGGVGEGPRKRGGGSRTFPT